MSWGVPIIAMNYRSLSTLRRFCQLAHALQHRIQAVGARGRELAGQAELIEPGRQVQLGQLFCAEAVDACQQYCQQAADQPGFAGGAKVPGVATAFGHQPRVWRENAPRAAPAASDGVPEPTTSPVPSVKMVASEKL